MYECVYSDNYAKILCIFMHVCMSCEGQDELVAILGKKLIKSLIRHISLPPIYTLGLIYSPEWQRVHPDLHVCQCMYK